MVAERARQRVVIEGVSPEIDGGAFPVRRAAGERVVVEADVFAAEESGAVEDALRCLLLWCREGDRQWSEVAMEPLPEDRFRGAFPVPEMGRYRYGLTAWVDPFRSEATRYRREVAVTVDRERARFGAWYGLAGSGGDAAVHLDRAAALGFDVVALPAGTPEERLPCLLARAREARQGGIELALGLEVQEPLAAGALGTGPEPRDAVERALALGVRAFTVERPERQPFPFWERLLGEILPSHPDALFLAGPSPRRKARLHLARLGFSQLALPLSGPHRPADLTAEWRELTASPLADLFHPNLRPDLAVGGWPLLAERLVLSATLAASFWVDGAALDRAEEHRERGERARTGSLAGLVARLNRIRHAHPALQSNASLAFHPVDNDRLLCYSKASWEGGDTVLTAVNLDPELRQSGWVDLDLDALGLPPGSGSRFEVHDLLSGARYDWHGRRNYLELDPWSQPAHVFELAAKPIEERT